MATASGQVVSDRVLTVPNALSFLRLLLVPVFALLILDGRDGWPWPSSPSAAPATTSTATWRAGGTR